MKLSPSEYQLRFKERTNTDYAILENSIAYDLLTTTVCFFARDTDENKPQNDNQCLYSYAVTGHHNALTFFTTPVLRVLINGNRRYLTCTKGMLYVSSVVTYQDTFK